ncbi:EAL domain-containing protein [Microtetraspora sp. AC03309]|uniref:EAL domain-containing protein n=1 Tax=Microtetraspora sp. AC03309 TaxID=2779376 RepID=UPI001E392C47|nr:EAL domain-containing protein [Microtetraspora sp. AC03309]
MSVPLPFAAPLAQSAPDVTASGSFAADPPGPGHAPAPVFLPIVDLDTGGVIAVEVAAGDVPGLAPSDISSTVRGLLAASRAEALLPLVLPIPARAVIGGSGGLAPLHEAVRVSGRRPRELILVIEGEIPAADRRALLAGIDGLRAAGYLVAFGGLGSAHLPLDLLADASPYVIVLARDLVDRVPRDPRRSALAESLVGVARALGAHVLAPGLRDEAQLAATRGWGIRLAQGPLLAPIDWKPSSGRVQLHVPLPVPDTTPVAALLGPRVQELLLPAVTLSSEATAEDVVAAFGSEPSITSVILVDEYQRPVGSVDRSRFLLFMAGAYGHALHAKKPARRLADTTRTVPRTTPAIAAMQLAGRDATRVYDDLVVVDEVGRCMGIVRVGDLIRHVATIPSSSR